MQRHKTNLIYVSMGVVLGGLLSLGCAPFGSDGKADRNGRLDRAEISVWVQSTAGTAGQYRVLFGAPSRASSVELCKIPASGLSAGFVCNQGKPGYQNLAHLTDKGERKIFVAEALEINDKDGYAVFAKQGAAILWNKPREAYFGKKNPGASAGAPVQFNQVKEVMARTCSGALCHSNGQTRDAFYTDAGAFASAKQELVKRLNSTDPEEAMPRGRSFQGNDKKTMLDYLNQIR